MFWKFWKFLTSHRAAPDRVTPDGSEELAVPEVHTGKVPHGQAEGRSADDEEAIHYENVAIPEVHIPHKKKP